MLKVDVILWPIHTDFKTFLFPFLFYPYFSSISFLPLLLHDLYVFSFLGERGRHS